MSSCLPHPQAAFLTIFDHITEQLSSRICSGSLPSNRPVTCKPMGLQSKIARVSVKNKRNALGHPAAQLGADLTIKDVLASEVMAWPVHRLMVSPTSDGAAAVVLAGEAIARRITDRPAWIKAWGGAWIPPIGRIAILPIPSMWKRPRGWPTEWPEFGNHGKRSTSPNPMIRSLTKNSIIWKGCNWRQKDRHPSSWPTEFCARW